MTETYELYANKETGSPFAVLVNFGEYMAGMQTLDRFVETPNLMIPAHDPRVLSIYPAPKPGLEGIAVKLDVMPA
jgi:hypothetical protein